MVGRERRGHQGRAPLPRERRHPGQVDPGQAQRPARGLRDRAGGQARVVRSPEPAPPARTLVPLALGASPRGRSSASALVGSALGGLPGRPHRRASASRAALIVLLAAWRREWEVPLHAFARHAARRGGLVRRRPDLVAGGARGRSTSRAASGSRSPAAGGGCATPSSSPSSSPASSTAGSASSSRCRS